MRHKDRFPNRFLSKEDFPKAKVLTMHRLKSEDVKTDNNGSSKTVQVLFFREIADRGLILNKFNSEKLDTLYGDDENWVGKKIVIFNDPDVTFAGKTIGGLRVRAPQTARPEVKPAPLSELPDEEDPDLNEEVSF